MKKKLLMVGIILFLTALWSGNSFARNYWYEKISVGSSTSFPGTSTFAAAAYDKYLMGKMYGRIVAHYHPETFPIMYRTDGTAPTQTEGFMLYVGDILVLDDIESIRNFKATGIGGTSTVKVGYVEESEYD